MKKFLLTVLMGMFAIAGFSQLNWDVRAGMTFSNMTKLDDSKALPGFTLGVGMDYGFTENWSLQSGLMFTSKGYKADIDVDDYSYKVRPVYLDIPILAAYKFNVSDNVKLVINAGPYMAIGIGGKAKLEENGDKEDWKVFGDEGGADRFDLGIQYGIGVELNEHYLINFSGQNGFISPYEGDDAPKNMSFALGVGYRF